MTALYYCCHFTFPGELCAAAKQELSLFTPSSLLSCQPHGRRIVRFIGLFRLHGGEGVTNLSALLSEHTQRFSTTTSLVTASLFLAHGFSSAHPKHVSVDFLAEIVDCKMSVVVALQLLQ